jgi:uncharacterized membrane-anchored protein
VPPLQGALDQAIAEGVLPPDAALPAHEPRPWPVVLLTGLGAWLAAVPLLGVVGLLLGDLISRSAGPYFVGALVLAGSVVVLRSRARPIFLEQLAVPGLLVGGGALAFGLFRDLPVQAAAALLALLALGVAWMIARPWLRVLLGAAAAGLLTTCVLPERWLRASHSPLVPIWLALHASLAVWLGALLWQRHGLVDGTHARDAAALESIAAGWLLLVLAGLCAWSGMSFLVGGSLGPFGELAGELRGAGGAGLGLVLCQAASAGIAIGALAVIARGWPSLRQPAVAVVGLVLVVLAFFMPALGGVLLALAWTATSQRWRLAGAAALAATWIVGSFYYQLHWPLANKAALLVGAAVVLGVLAWIARRPLAAEPGAASTAPQDFGRNTALIVLTLAATLGIANYSIWQKEDLIARGDKVFVALAPLDPRSLMQGDYMRLNFQLPDTGAYALAGQRPHVAALRDARGVALPQRVVQPGDTLAPGEMRIELTPKNGRWTLVTDAWFFREGDAERWQQARFGEFRVLPDGRALLVGLADADLKNIPIPK